jgi:hypothetical protein
MRGPLAILRDTWLGFRNLPVSLGRRTEDFLKEVKQGLDAAQSYAAEHTRLAQQRYVTERLRSPLFATPTINIHNARG